MDIKDLAALAKDIATKYTMPPGREPQEEWEKAQVADLANRIHEGLQVARQVGFKEGAINVAHQVEAQLGALGLKVQGKIVKEETDEK